MENKINEIGKILADIQYDINIIKNKILYINTKSAKLQIIDWLENNFIKTFDGELKDDNIQLQEMHKAIQEYNQQKLAEFKIFINNLL